MLIKRHVEMRPTALRVKNPLRASMAATLVSLACMAPNAFAKSDNIREVEVSVRISLTDYRAEGGVEQVYNQLKAEALKSCKSDRRSLALLDQTVESCAESLLTQFIDSVDLVELTAYHASRVVDA